MTEYSVLGVILAKEPRGEEDVHIYIFTKEWGLIRAKAKSARKITSKLSAHLEPNLVSRIRLVENKETWVVDSLRLKKLAVPLGGLDMVKELSPPWQTDKNLFNYLVGGKYEEINLRLLNYFGFSPSLASCEWCGGAPEVFLKGEHIFLCQNCALTMSESRVLLWQ